MFFEDINGINTSLFIDVCQIIDGTRTLIATTVNAKV
jgi:hypothetical protein